MSLPVYTYVDTSEEDARRLFLAVWLKLRSRRESCVQRFWSRRSGETSLPIYNARVCGASVVAPLLTTRVFRRELRYDVADSAAAATFARIAAPKRTVSSSDVFLFRPSRNV